jgi:hypothetical protein
MAPLSSGVRTTAGTSSTTFETGPWSIPGDVAMCRYGDQGSGPKSVEPQVPETPIFGVRLFGSPPAPAYREDHCLRPNRQYTYIEMAYNMIKQKYTNSILTSTTTNSPNP